ncbi:hypothetical protein EVC24_053 [Rhizobium phage RHph_I4]|nr:hypothetical protein EVC24_053 [Rhizobium phage RHph_I4]
MESVVVTGVFSLLSPSGRYHITRAKLSQLFQIVGWRMDVAVSGSTDRVYAQNVMGNSSKLQSARVLAVPVYSYAEMNRHLEQELMRLNGGNFISAITVLHRMERYGVWRDADSGVQQVAAARGSLTVPGGAQSRYDVSLKVGMNVKKEVAQPQAKVGQLQVKRNVKL